MSSKELIEMGYSFETMYPDMLLMYSRKCKDTPAWFRTNDSGFRVYFIFKG